MSNVISALESQKLAIFMPSTIFIDETSKLFGAYVDAKIDAEKMLLELTKKSKGQITAYMPRLPVLATDQSVTYYNQDVGKTARVLVSTVREFIGKTSP